MSKYDLLNPILWTDEHCKELIDKGLDRHLLCQDIEATTGEITWKLLEIFCTVDHKKRPEQVYISKRCKKEYIERICNMFSVYDIMIFDWGKLDQDNLALKYFINKGGQLPENKIELVIAVYSDDKVILGCI